MVLFPRMYGAAVAFLGPFVPRVLARLGFPGYPFPPHIRIGIWIIQWVASPWKKKGDIRF